ncbi:lytic polysaccharide monooxygenase [Actinomadura sp. NPDC047616]|uniref:lytic polysaccharide monooxygenase auxiliary activity family 9 protein n=1 Tax=Actinomadura sp. NPDC047616 TaxID=3155914 RepID=UPI0033D8FFBC
MRLNRMLRRALTMLSAAALVPLVSVDTASAHGSVIDPASRNYGCWQRWGSDHLNPNMAQQDPMCWQAWQDNPNAMWNWNGLYQNNVGGNHQAVVRDGQLCSGGLAEGGRYRSLDAVGAWKMKDISSTFTINLYDQASHGADYIRVYVTRQGYNALTQPLRWSDLELVRETPRYAPANNYVVSNVNVSGRSGRHVVYTVWKASHMDQTYYICSDVNFR